MKLSTVFTLGLAALPELASASFAQTCKDWYIEGTTFRPLLVATCSKSDGHSPRRTRHDLNLCMGLSYGDLVSRKDGNAFTAGACINIGWSGTQMSAQCLGLYGYKNTAIDLNSFIHNSNGFLTCHGYLGAPY
ncbi:hypothetical protein QBC35DRAFT_548949 [Podospora australis]|uniref:Cyanovirin-N domain-containing protein n=1 Tax=Podospora australis TaxID=1536484 RepID=A0AAN7AIK2_9PEZI|nr:hypothetical protein QBC35DRAFT_548949 [Podospora australis]